MSSNTASVDILFYAERSLHLAYLEPIHDYFQKWYPDLCLAFSAPAYHPSCENTPGWGLQDNIIKRLSNKTKFIPEDKRIHPRINVVADSCYYNLPRQGKVVNVGHTLTSKGFYYRRDPVVRRENLADLLCVPGPWHKRRLMENVFTPIRVTGFIKSDALFGPDAVGKKSFCKKYSLDPTKHIILFAPTFNPELSAIPYLWDQVTTLGDSHTVVGIKLHPMTPVQWQMFYKDLAKKNEDVLFLDDQDYSGMMHAADVMVSDASSMFVEFMLLEKPVVLFNSPKMESFEHYHPDDIEHKVRDASLEAESVSMLHRKVDKALEHPDILQEKRLQYIKDLDYGRDGKSAQRAGETIRDLLHSPRKQGSRLKYSVLIELAANNALEQKAISEVTTKSKDQPLEMIPIITRNKSCMQGRYDNMLDISPKYLYQASDAIKGEWVVLLKAGWVLPENWPKFMENHFHWNNQVGMVKAMHDALQVRHIFSLLFHDRPFKDNNDELTWDFRNIGIGSAAYNDGITSPCVMLPASIFHAAVSKSHKNINFITFSNNLEKLLFKSGYISATSIETFIYPFETINMLTQIQSK